MVLAHAGHWYTEILYMSPVLLVGAFIGLSNLREKRRAARREERGTELAD